MNTLFYVAVDNASFEFRVCDEHGDSSPLHEAAESLMDALAEIKQAAYHERYPDAGSVDFGEWLYERTAAVLHAERDDQTRLGPFLASELMLKAERYSPHPWKGHPNYEE